MGSGRFAVFLVLLAFGLAGCALGPGHAARSAWWFDCLVRQSARVCNDAMG